MMDPILALAAIKTVGGIVSNLMAPPPLPPLEELLLRVESLIVTESAVVE